MKNINIDFLKKELIDEAFDFAGKRPERAMTTNYNQARVFLGPYGRAVAKDTIEKIKAGEIEDIPKKELDNTLLAIHVFKKIAASKKNYKVKEEATRILKNNGIDLATRTEEDLKIFKQAEKTFKKKYKEVNPPAEAKPAEEPATEIPTAEQPTKAEVPAEEPTSREEPDETPEKKPEEEPKPEPEKVPTARVPVKIKELWRDAIIKFGQRVGLQQDDINVLITMTEDEELYEQQDEMSRFKAGQIERYLRGFSRKMDALARKAREMPSTAQDRLRTAQSEAAKSVFRAIRLASPSALNILKQRIQETGKGAVEKVKEVGKRAVEKITKTPAAEKTREVYKKAKEFTKAKAEQAVEKVISKAEEKRREKEGGPVQEKPETKLKTGISKLKEKLAGIRKRRKTPKEEEEERRKRYERFVGQKKLAFPRTKAKIRTVKF